MPRKKLRNKLKIPVFYIYQNAAIQFRIAAFCSTKYYKFRHIYIVVPFKQIKQRMFVSWQTCAVLFAHKKGRLLGNIYSRCRSPPLQSVSTKNRLEVYPMGFNYEKEKRIFEAEWKKLAVEYSEAGLDATGIQEMRDFDWKLFKQRRTYENSVQAFPSEVIDNGNNKCRSTLLGKFPQLTNSFDEGSFMSRQGWIEDITNTTLLDKLAVLSDSDIELITLYVFDGYKQEEIAALQGCSHQAISKRIKRLKIFLK